MSYSKKGFTLIELLVVIAILGLLSGVVLVALNSTRSRGNDGKVKPQMSNIRSAAEAYSGVNGNYGTAANCSLGMFANANSGMLALVTASNYPTGTTFDCGAVPGAYSVAAKLSSGAWCVDSAGASRDKTKTGTTYTALTGSVSAAHTAAGATVCN